jgi:hypothetical protein
MGRLIVKALLLLAVVLATAAPEIHASSTPTLSTTGADASHSKEIIRAATKGDIDAIKKLLSEGVDVNARDADGWTPLMRAAWNGKTAAVLVLLANGADAQAANTAGETSLIKAGQRGFTEIISLLENAGAKKTAITLNDSEQPAASLTPAQGWALATVAISNQQNGFSHNLLGGETLTPQARVNAIYGLKNWWGVTTKEETADVLHWLLTEGHHKEYEQLADVTGHTSATDFEALLQKYSDNPEVIFKLRFAKENRERLGKKSLLAWDLCRYVQVAGLAYVAGYFTEEEAWVKIMPAAKLIQENFDSWSDMGDNYLMGRLYWAGERNSRLDYIYSLLANQKDGHSPWNKYPWKTDLALPLTPAVEAQPTVEDKPTAKVEPRAKL